jgi:hypothetical protein
MSRYITNGLNPEQKTMPNLKLRNTMAQKPEITLKQRNTAAVNKPLQSRIQTYLFSKTFFYSQIKKNATYNSIAKILNLGYNMEQQLFHLARKG